MDDRRVDERLPCDLLVRVYLDDAEAIDARTSDISRSGICLVLERKLPVGTPFGAGLRLVLPGAHSDELLLAARSVWSGQVRDGFQAGAMFTNLTRATQERLDIILKVLRGEIGLG